MRCDITREANVILSSSHQNAMKRSILVMYSLRSGESRARTDARVRLSPKNEIVCTWATINHEYASGRDLPRKTLTVRASTSTVRIF